MQFNLGKLLIIFHKKFDTITSILSENIFHSPYPNLQFLTKQKTYHLLCFSIEQIDFFKFPPEIYPATIVTK